MHEILASLAFDNTQFSKFTGCTGDSGIANIHFAHERLNPDTTPTILIGKFEHDSIDYPRSPREVVVVKHGRAALGHIGSAKF